MISIMCKNRASYIAAVVVFMMTALEISAQTSRQVFEVQTLSENNGPTVRYVSRGRRSVDVLLMNWDGKAVTLHELAASDIEDITFGGGAVKWKNEDGKVVVESLSPIGGALAAVLKVRLKSDLTVLFIGDSITDGGWGRSGGMPKSSAERNKTDQNHTLGHSYVMLAAARIMADEPTLKCNWLNRGISGNTVDDLKQRWTEDMLLEDPDILTVMVGINDVFKYYRKDRADDFDVEAWTAQLKGLLTEARNANPSIKVVMMSPFVAKGKSVNEELFPRIKKAVDECAMSVEALAKELGAVYIDTNSLFNSITTGNPESERWLWDGIHPTPAGHQLIADRWIECVKKENFM